MKAEVHCDAGYLKLSREQLSGAAGADADKTKALAMTLG